MTTEPYDPTRGPPHWLGLLLASAISITAFAVRLFDLAAQGLTVDELFWIYRGPYFVGTLTSPWARTGAGLNLPAVALIGLSTKWLTTLGTVAAARLPIAVMGALTCLVLMFFVWREYSPRIALLAGALLALDPLHMGLSRTAGIDAALTFFLTLSFLSFFESERKQSVIYALISGCSLGFAFTTKPNAALALPTVAIYLVILSIVSPRNIKSVQSPSTSVRPRTSKLHRLVVLIVTAVLTVFLAWPDMWSNPTYTISAYLSSTFTNVTSGHTNFFAGVVTNSPPFYYYFVIVPIRLPEVTLVGLTIGLVWIGYRISKRRLTRFEWFILSWVLVFFVVMSLSATKLEARYVLPVWPPLLVFSALGLDVLVKAMARLVTFIPDSETFTVNNRRVWSAIPVMLVVVLALSFPLFSFFPNYLLYYNAAVGGPESAKRVTLVGWGEGSREAALYLKGLDEQNISIAIAGYPSIVEYYYPTAHLVDLTQWRDADYLVVYTNWLQRNPNDEIMEYIRDKTPIATVALSGCSLVWIYAIE